MFRDEIAPVFGDELDEGAGVLVDLPALFVGA
jgi:hypothetical protein